MNRSLRVCLVSLTLVYTALSGAVRADLLMEIGDAYATREADGWSIGTAGIRLSLVQQGDVVSVGAITSPVSETEWLRRAGSDSSVVINGQRVAIGGTLTRLQGVAVSEWNGGVRLDFRYALTSPAELIVDWYNRNNPDRRAREPLADGGAVQIMRSYVAYPGSSVIEAWNTFESATTAQITLADLNVYTLATKVGVFHWINGLNASEADGGPFTRLSGDLEEGQAVTLGSDRRATEQRVPFFSFKDGDEEFFGALAWSGSWRMRVERQDDIFTVQVGLPPFSTVVPSGGRLETPHAIVGVTSRLFPEVPQALRRYIDLGLRNGRPLQSYVSYNTWFTYGTFVDEETLKAEMELAASLGVEQFVLDAGWWFRINPQDQSDFGRSWGNWEIDPERFPNGLGVLSDHAHALGMRFGIWVEPERVDLRTVGAGVGASERFLAMEDGRYIPDTPNSQAWSAQVCLADPAARAWVTERILSLVAASRADYVKWDNNLWVTCNRAGHGHGTADGNFRHHQGLGSVLDDLRARLPGLDVENCSAGGNRLTLDQLARSEYAWVDDRTDVSSRVRHSFGGLAAIFPPAYLLTFAVTGGEAAGEATVADARFVLRSRMVSSWGFSMPLSQFDDAGRAVLAAEIAKFKEIRPIILNGSAFSLGPQAPAPGQAWAGWDALQYVTPGAREALVMAFATHDAPESATIRMKGLEPFAQYSVTSLDAGLLGSVRGIDLMGEGLVVQTVPGAATGHIIVVRAE
jgi:alpha-galactosidase